MEPVALYVCPRGPYPKILAEWYDETRDARTFTGQAPVVAHPPCGPWGRLYHLCTKQDASAGPHAVRVVQANGGVLEHPADSKLWDACGLPRPGERTDRYGGFTVCVKQVSWGHPCEKKTWLYFVRVDRSVLWANMRRGGVASHCVTRCRLTGKRERALKFASKDQRTHTPEAFARFLVDVANTARRRDP